MSDDKPGGVRRFCTILPESEDETAWVVEAKDHDRVVAEAEQHHLDDTAVYERMLAEKDRIIERLKAALEKIEARSTEYNKCNGSVNMIAREALAELEAQNSSVSDPVTDENQGISDREGEK